MRIAQIVLAILVIGFILYNLANDYFDKQYVRDDYSVTFGKVINYQETTSGQGNYLTYSYFINGKECERKLRTNTSLKECVKEPLPCSKKYFLVIYSNKNFCRSLINLKDEVRNAKEISTKFKLAYMDQKFDTVWIFDKKELPIRISRERFE